MPRIIVSRCTAYLTRRSKSRWQSCRGLVGITMACEKQKTHDQLNSVLPEPRCGEVGSSLIINPLTPTGYAMEGRDRTVIV